MSASSCPDPKSLSGYAIGTLSPEAADRIEEHVQSCPDCEATLNSIDVSSDTIMTALRRKAPPPVQTADATMVTGTGFDEAAEAPPAAPATSEDGSLQTLGNYILLEKIGAGGMGQVYKARHRRMDRVVALKVLPAHLTQDRHAIARFEREVKAAARISHPNIVAAYDADQAGDVHFLVMEYVEGMDLSALVKRSGPLTVARAVDCILQAARGLQAAHAEKIVHRDIKPANLLLDPRGTVKILDMGLARMYGNEAQQAELTASGAVMGTVDYMAPEQALDTHTADARADIYSLGCTLYYLLSGNAAYQGETLTAKLLAHQSHPIPELRAACPEVSPALETTFRKMVAKDLNNRYQTMSELIADLERLQPEALQDVRSESRRTKRPAMRTEPLQAGGGGNRPKRWLIAGGAAALLAVLAIVVVSLQTDDGTLVVELNEKDAKIEIDGKEITVKQKKLDKDLIKISVDPGQHRIVVRKDGFQTYSNDEVEIKTGQGTPIKATLIPKSAVATTQKPVKPQTPPIQLPSRNRTRRNREASPDSRPQRKQKPPHVPVELFCEPAIQGGSPSPGLCEPAELTSQFPDIHAAGRTGTLRCS